MCLDVRMRERYGKQQVRKKRQSGTGARISALVKNVRAIAVSG